jgi:hypothetical protein
MKRDKISLTENLVKLLPQDQQTSTKLALNTWWYNLRKNGGMRLTTTGYHALVKLLAIEHYEFVISDPMQFNQHMILDLDHKMQMPYYIHAVKGIPKKIVFFGSREAVMVNLYGDLKRFLENYVI